MTHFNKNKTGARERRVEERNEQEEEQELQLQLCNCRRSREVCDVAVAQWEEGEGSEIKLVICEI